MSFFESYQQTVFFHFGEMDFPSTTETVDVYTANYLSTRNYSMLVTVSNIDDSVVVRLEGTLDGTNFGPMLSETITQDGTYAYNSTGFPVRKLRANFFRENGGTNAVVKFSVAAN
jgi:hypothetical protein